MLIEFIGCTGAGKTTLVKGVKDRLLSLGLDAISSTHFIAETTGTYWIKSERLQNVALSFILCPWFIKAFRFYRSYIFFALRTICCNTTPILDRVNRIRHVVRLLGGNELLRGSCQGNRFVLIDEGAIGSAHHVLVGIHHSPMEEDILTFANLVPIPDLVIHVDTPVRIALERTLRRPDPPIGIKSVTLVEEFIKHGRDVFEIFSGHRNLDGRFMTVTNRTQKPKKIDLLVDQIVEFILTRISHRNIRTQFKDRSKD